MQSESYYKIPPIKYFPAKRTSILPELTLKNVEAEIKKADILCRNQVFAQIKLESGNLNSFLLKRTNNMLGMRYPYRRPTTAIGLYLPLKDSIVYGDQKELLKYKKVLTYAVYNDWVSCIQDYKLWQEQNFNLEKRYLDFLKKNYAEDTLYVNKIRVMSERKKDKASASASVAK